MYCLKWLQQSVLLHDHVDKGLAAREVEIAVPGHGFIGNEKDDRSDSEEDQIGDDKAQPISFKAVDPGERRSEAEITDLDAVLC